MSRFIPEALEKILKDSGLPYKKQTRSFVLQCPRCHKKDKLWILRNSGAFVCWHCKEIDNFKGWAPQALAELLGQSQQEIRSKLYEGGVPPGNELNLNLTDFDEELIDLPTTLNLSEIEWPWESLPITEHLAIKGAVYLASRGIPMSIATEYDIHYWIPYRRVLFPVKQNGKLVGYQGRAIDSWQKPKILTSTGLRKEHALMFEHRLEGQNHVVLCEGPVDAIKAHLCGGNVATMGKAVSKAQLDIIKNKGIKLFYLALDPDALDETARLVNELGDCDTRIMTPPKNKKDLGECSYEEVYQAFKEAQRYTPGSLFLKLKPLA